MYTGSMVRTQIYLPDDLHRALGHAARRRGVSMAELIRRAAETVVTNEDSVTDPLADITGIDDRGPTDMAEQHDAHLFGKRHARRAKPRR
jgi:hypothetical protein